MLDPGEGQQIVERQPDVSCSQRSCHSVDIGPASARCPAGAASAIHCAMKSDASGGGPSNSARTPPHMLWPMTRMIRHLEIRTPNSNAALVP